MCNWVSQRYVKNAVKYLFETWTVPKRSGARDALGRALLLLSHIFSTHKNILRYLGGSITGSECTLVLDLLRNLSLGSISPGPVTFLPFLTALPAHFLPSHALPSHPTAPHLHQADSPITNADFQGGQNPFGGELFQCAVNAVLKCASRL